ncbi:unnamed protein product [Ilex paraguariensis]|uniref:FHA domain-containing protein n=1 Tax=Ilex paraguariensis TaxID=185542 RepID=A0ABC8UR69_9AQUA
MGLVFSNQQGYDQSGISRKGSEDTSDQHCTIFFDKEKVELVEGGTFWLSESPSVPGSMSWGSAIVNTNMDEFSPRARRRSALLTWQHIASLPPSLPVLYCGGFNTQKESTAGRFLLGRSRYHVQLHYDVYDISSATNYELCSTSILFLLYICNQSKCHLSISVFLCPVSFAFESS